MAAVTWLIVLLPVLVTSSLQRHADDATLGDVRSGRERREGSADPARRGQWDRNGGHDPADGRSLVRDHVTC